MRTSPAPLSGKIDALVHQWQQSTGATGVSVAVRKGGRAIAQSTAGVADATTGRPMSSTDSAYIGSVTKLATAATVVRLADEGKLSLDDRLSKWAPRFPESGKITVRQLLEHTSGVPDYLQSQPMVEGMLQPPGDTQRNDAPTRLAAEMPRTQPPGAGWQYSNTNYQLLGQIIGATTGRPWEDVVREQVLEPSGVPYHVAFNRSGGPLQATAHPTFAPFDQSGATLPTQPWDVAYTSESALRSTLGPDGGAITSAATLAKLGESLLWDKGSALTPTERTRMLAPTRWTHTAGGTPVGYGLGVQRMPHGTAPDGDHRWIYGHTGHVPGYLTMLGHEAGTDVTVAVEVNQSSFDPKAAPDLRRLFTSVFDTVDAKR